jgi:hypothetical protein
VVNIGDDHVADVAPEIFVQIPVIDCCHCKEVAPETVALYVIA